jgi:ethanolamine ammonia-lyase small subunit
MPAANKNISAAQSIKKFTQARIALGRKGVSVPAKEMLQFKMDHAHARDAVFSLLEIEKLSEELSAFNLPVFLLKSKAADKHIYLRRPDLGRKLDENSIEQLSVLKDMQYDVCIAITDGLSATAINNHARNLLSSLLPLLNKANFKIAPLCLIERGRVAIADEAASWMNAKLSLILIGERPGLSSPDSLGAYITYNPSIGLTDERRNCVSNIRPEGLQYKQAAQKITYLIKEAFRLQLSGVGLKENNIDKLPEL